MSSVVATVGNVLLWSLVHFRFVFGRSGPASLAHLFSLRLHSGFISDSSSGCVCSTSSTRNLSVIVTNTDPLICNPKCTCYCYTTEQHKHNNSWRIKGLNNMGRYAYSKTVIFIISAEPIELSIQQNKWGGCFLVIPICNGR